MRQRMYLVTDPTKLSTVGDILSYGTALALGNLARGSYNWNDVHPVFHSTRSEALSDARKRITAIHGSVEAAGFLLNPTVSELD